MDFPRKFVFFAYRAIMKGTPPSRNTQYNLVKKTLMEQLDFKRPLMLLAASFPWEYVEKKYSQFYSPVGRRAKSIRLMIGLIILKQLRNLSDVQLLEEWVENPYYQYFCGEKEFQHKFPCDSSDITYFRKRIGEEGFAELLKISTAMHGKNAQENEIVIDSTVQEKNITYPTDIKLFAKIIGRCKIIAKKENIKLRSLYKKELRDLFRTVRFENNKKNTSKVKRAKTRIKTITGRFIREINRKLSDSLKEKYKDNLEIFNKIFSQKKKSHNKIFSVHEPQVVCVKKGKAGKKCEFGSKVSFAITKTTGIIVGAAHFLGNPYDGNTLEKTLENVLKNTNKIASIAYCDRGYRGKNEVNGTKIETPGVPKKTSTPSEKKKARQNFGRRCSIEPIIGHLKHDFRMARNRLKGSLGDAINMFAAAMAFNLAKWMRLSPLYLTYCFYRIFLIFPPVFAPCKAYYGGKRYE